MKTLIIVITVGFIILLAGCSKPVCTSPNGHEWTSWKNEWKQVSDVGHMRQSRTCKKCGLIETELHW